MVDINKKVVNTKALDKAHDKRASQPSLASVQFVQANQRVAVLNPKSLQIEVGEPTVTKFQSEAVSPGKQIIKAAVSERAIIPQTVAYPRQVIRVTAAQAAAQSPSGISKKVIQAKNRSNIPNRQTSAIAVITNKSKQQVKLIYSATKRSLLYSEISRNSSGYLGMSPHETLSIEDARLNPAQISSMLINNLIEVYRYDSVESIIDTFSLYCIGIDELFNLSIDDVFQMELRSC